MGSRGPQPLPSNVHLLRGNPSKKSATDLLDDFNPEVEIPTSPKWLWPEAKKEWRRIGAERIVTEKPPTTSTKLITVIRKNVDVAACRNRMNSISMTMNSSVDKR